MCVVELDQLVNLSALLNSIYLLAFQIAVPDVDEEIEACNMCGWERRDF